MAWRLPLIIQGIPAVALAVGIWFLPYSPRLLVKHHKDDDALKALSRLRQRPADDELVRVEFLEIKSESLFEEQSLTARFPNIAGNTWKDRFLRELAQYSLIFRNKDAFKRVALGALVMFFQQWSGIDSSWFYLPPLLNSNSTNRRISYLLRPDRIPKPRLNRQHHLPPSHWRCWYHQCRDNNPGHTSD